VGKKPARPNTQITLASSAQPTAHDPDCTVEDLIGLIYDAALDQSRWPDFLSALATAVRCDRALFALLIGGNPWNVACLHGWTLEEIALWRARYVAQDPWGNVHKHNPVRVGEVRTSTELLSMEETEKTLRFAPFTRRET
jgi:hypothetical protein